MQSFLVATLLFAGCCLAALVGLGLRSRLAEDRLDSETRASVTTAAGLIASMSALLLGLLVANAQSAYDSVSTEVDQMAANLVQLDRTLGAFGPAAAEARALLRESVVAEIDRIWPPNARSVEAVASVPVEVEQARSQLMTLIERLPAETDAQRNRHRTALDLVAVTTRTRVLILSQVRSDLPLPIILVVSSWLVMLFLGFGLLTRQNAVALIALTAGAASVAGAMFLILELNRPFGGIMQIQPESMRAALMLMGR
jgi:hypothetical protein